MGDARICKQCGKQFLKSGAMRDFCSTACRKDYQREYRRRYYQANKAAKLEREKEGRAGEKRVRLCEICGAALPGRRQRYCSDQCRNEAYRRVAGTGTGQEKRAYKCASVQQKACQDCGVVFAAHPRAKRCPACGMAAKMDYVLSYNARKKAGLARAIGSTDTCTVCGQPYIVSGGMQRMCASCRAQKKKAECHEYYHKKMEKEGEREKFNARRHEKKWRAFEPVGRKCKQCGQVFAPDKTRYRYCSEDCRRAAVAAYQAEYRKAKNEKGKDKQDDPVQ